MFVFLSILWSFVKMFPEFTDPALILKSQLLRVFWKQRSRPLSDVCANFFYFMVLEQVNLIRERQPYGKIEKKY